MLARMLGGGGTAYPSRADEVKPGCPLEALIMKLKLKNLGCMMQKEESLTAAKI